jgi:hypothetical protein
LLRVNDDWLYSEWATGGWVQHIVADGTVLRASPPPPLAPVEQSTQ